MESPDGQTLKGPGDEDNDQIVSTLGEIGCSKLFKLHK